MGPEAKDGYIANKIAVPEDGSGDQEEALGALKPRLIPQQAHRFFFF
jgi:hypothetical protein